MKKAFKKILSDRHHRCSTVRQLEAEGGHEWAESSLRVIQVIRCDGQGTGQAETFELSRMPNTSTEMVSMDGSFLSMIKMVLSFAGSFELLYSASFVEASIKDFVDDMMLLQCLPKQSHSPFVRLREIRSSHEDEY